MVVRTLNMKSKHSPPKAYISAATDFQNQKQVEEASLALRERESRFITAYECAPIGVKLWDTDGVILHVNKATCEMSAYTETDLVGRNNIDFTHPDDIDSRDQSIKRLLSGEIDQYQVVNRHRHKLGHYIWVDIHITLIRDTRDLPLYLVEYAHDITERNRVEDALNYNQALYSQAEKLGKLGHWEWDKINKKITKSDLYKG